MNYKRLYAPIFLAALSLLLYSCSNLDRDDPDSLLGMNWLDDQGSSSSSTAANLSSGMQSSSSIQSSSGIQSSSAVQSSSSMQGYSAPAQTSSSMGISSPSSSSLKQSSSSSPLSSTLSSSSSSSPSSSAGLSYGNVSTATHSYNTITIGTQTWMAENLNEGTFVFATDATQPYPGQVTDSLEKYCFFNEESYCTSRGGLYTWAEAMNLPANCNISACADQMGKGICPTGWHLPSRADFDILKAEAGGATKAGAMLKALNGNSIWDNRSYNYGNSLGFGAKGVGFYDADTPEFAMNEGAELYWISEESNGSKAYQYTLDASDTEFKVEERTKLSAVSVRCVKD